MIHRLQSLILDHVGVGLFGLDKNMNLVLWNDFMAKNSRRPAETVLHTNLFESFPELPKAWLEKKIKSVFILKNQAFTSWEQRPWLFQFAHNRPMTGGIDSMQQNCTFIPLKDDKGEIEAVAVVLMDVTDAAIYQRMLMDANKKLEESSNRDGLTGIFNRRYIEHTLNAEIKRVQRHGGELSILMFDLDHFKKINDVYGHLGGDEVLRETGRRVGGSIRETDVAGRYGGEEFLLVMPHTNPEQAMVVAERLRKKIEASPVVFGELAIAASASLGVTGLSGHHNEASHMIHEADLALYAAKKGGRNRAICYDPLLHKDVA